MHPLIQNRLLNGISKLAGLTVHLTGRDSMIYNAVLVEKRKQKLIITDQKQEMNADQLKVFIPRNCPVLINIEGWGVLVKKATFNEDGELTGSLVPNADDFEVFTHRQDNSGFAAVIRKEHFTGILEQIKHFGFQIADISCGPFAIDSLIKLLNLEGNIIAGNWSLKISDGFIEDVKMLPEKQSVGYKLDDDIIYSPYLPSFAQIVQFYAGYYSEENLNFEFRKEISYKRLSVLIGWAALLFLLGALLGNYFWFESLSKRYNAISSEYRLNETVLQKLKIAETELKQTEDLIIKGGLVGSSSFAFFSDRIASCLPNGITLTRMEILPLKGKMISGKEIQFFNQTIIIEGETYEVLLIDRWINTIKKEDWVKDVRLDSFFNDGDNEPSVFKITIDF